MLEEVTEYITKCEEHEELRKLDDVYVTNHELIPKKYTTSNEEEDQDFFNYQQSIEEYNKSNSTNNRVFGSRKSDYERGSLLQRAVDPFFGSGRDENGTLIVNIEDRDLAHYQLDNEEHLRSQFNYQKEKGEVWEMEEDEDAARIQILKELEEKPEGYDLDDWNEIIRKELGIFTPDTYSFTRDLKSAYHRSLRTSTEQKILETIPDHYFWDIKTPQNKQPIVRQNRYNPFRGREFENFFEMRASEEYLENIHKKSNRNDSVSMYRRY